MCGLRQTSHEHGGRRLREIAVSLMAGLKQNLDWFPRYQAYLREQQPQSLIVWGPQDGYMPEGSARATCAICRTPNCILSTAAIGRSKPISTRSSCWCGSFCRACTQREGGAGLRYRLAAVVLLILVRDGTAPFRGRFAGRAVIAALLVNATYALLFWGVQFVDSGVAGLINLSSVPIGSNISSDTSLLPNAGVSLRYFSTRLLGGNPIGSASAAVRSVTVGNVPDGAFV